MTNVAAMTQKVKNAWAILILILCVETLGAAYLVFISLKQVFTATDPLQDLVALVIMALIGFLWVLSALAGAVRYRSWARALAVTVQVALFAVSLSMLQGVLGSKTLAFALMAIAAAGLWSAALARGVLNAKESLEQMRLDKETAHK